MGEHRDELHALADADPATPMSPAAPRDPQAVALFERITMTDTQAPPSPAARDGRRRARVLVAATGFAVIVLAAGVTVALVGDDDDPAPTRPDDIAEGPITPGGTSSASCVEVYDLQTLANREVAFAGTVQSVDGDDATFAVERWYRGGEDAEVTLAGATGLSGLTSVGDAVLEPGAHLLVAGDGGFAWSCGFTQPYDGAVAEQWAEVFAAG